MMEKSPFLWNDLPEQYSDAVRSQAFIGEELIHTIDFKPTDLVLDAGCGVGNLTLEIARKVPEGSITGMDISQGRIDQCKELFRKEKIFNARFYTGSIEEMTEEEEYTIIFSNSVFQWVTDLNRAMDHFHRALRPGGLMAIQFPRLFGDHPMIFYPEKAIRELRLEEYFIDWSFPACVPSKEELMHAMERAGFTGILIREDETAFSFPTAQKLFDHFKNVGYVRYVQRLPEEYKEAFLQKILQDIEEDYTKNKTQRCRRWFVYGRKKEGTATL